MRTIFVIAVAFIMGAVAPAIAQSVPRGPIQSPILTIDSDRLFEESAFGQQTITEFEALGAALAAENRRIEEALLVEERDLTDVRPTIDPSEFRALADIFDEKVQETRRAQDTKGRELNAELEERRVVFLNAAVPILEQLMRESGAAIVLEQRSVFISSTAVDITQMAIQRLDLVLDTSDFMPDVD